MRHKNEVTLADALQQMLNEYRLKATLDETKVQQLWPKLMGKTIATYTSSITVKKGVLQLQIMSAPLRQELSFSKDKIRDLINEEMGAHYIKEVIIR
jgi:predicted nucleic acid-binding Zn ribbon protein